MQMLSREECQRWCLARGVSVTGRVEKPSFSMSSKPNCFAIKVPDKGTSRASLSIAIFNDDPRHPIKFNGGLFWLHTWGFWSQDIDDMGVLTMHLMLDAFASSPDLKLYPGIVFDKTEWALLRVFFATNLIYEWDSSFVDSNGDYIVFSSHDGVLYIICRSADEKARLVGKYAPYWPVIDGRCPAHLRTV
jgi:hypothetical protein